MPSIMLDSAIARLSGSIDGFVDQHYKNDKRGVVLSRRPDMSNVEPSAAQLAHREKMRGVGAFHRRVLVDPKLEKKFERIAKEQGINLSAAMMGEVLRAKHG